MIAEVAVFGFTIKPGTYTYTIPDGFKPQIGQAVAVPFGKSLRQGVITKISGGGSDFKLKEISRGLSETPVLSGAQLKLAAAISERYFFPLAEAIHLFLPRIPRTPTLIDQSIKKAVKQELLLFPTLRQAEAASRAKQGLLFIHSSTSEFDRQWSEIASGQAKCVIGTKSALFAPFAHLTKITVFQTESDLYKEERRPYYRVLEVASLLAGVHRATLEAVSFSPRVADQFLTPHQIKKLDATPQSESVNLRQNQIVNDHLLTTLNQNAGKKVLLFLNRKSEKGPLRCRTCKVTSYTDDPSVCPNCGSADVKFRTFNLTSIAKDIGKEASGDFTFATQQIFFQGAPSFDLVVLLSADTYLTKSDFLAQEKTFQLITGLMRLTKPNGKIIVQTTHPEDPAVKDALRNDYQAFYSRELALRKQTGYPPFTKIAKLTYAAKGTLPELESTDRLEVFGPFNGPKFSYLIVREQDLSPLAKLGRPWKLDIDPLNL